MVGTTWVSTVVVHCSALKLSGTGIKNLNTDCLSTIVQSRDIQTMWSSTIGMFGSKTEHLVKTDNNLRKSIVILLHSLTGTCNSSTYPIGPLCKYFVHCQILQLPIYSRTRWEKDWHSNLLVGAFFVFSILLCAVAALASAMAISMKFSSSALKVLGKTSLHCLFRFWTYRNPFLCLIFFLQFFLALHKYLSR